MNRMNNVSLDEARCQITKYLQNEYEQRPYLVLIDDDQAYQEIKSFVGGNEIKTSDYCKLDDSFPDYDWLITGINNVPKDSVNVLLGFGEALNLQFATHDGVSGETASKTRKLSLLYNNSFPGKVVVLCKYLYSEIQEISRSDAKFTSDRYCHIQSRAEYPSCKVIQTTVDLNCETINGFKNLLSRLEDGYNGSRKLYIRSSLLLNGVEQITSAFDAIGLDDPHFTGERNWLSEEQWEEYRADKDLSNKDITHWRTFLDLKLNGAHGSSERYIAHVINNSTTYMEYKKNVFAAILDFSTKDDDFKSIYEQRKSWIQNAEENELSVFISDKLITKDDSFQIYYLTDNTIVERQAILRWIGANGLTNDVRRALEWIYPDLYWYLSSYHFRDLPDLISNDEFDAYFNEYRFQKVVNCLSEEFLERVNRNSLDGSRPYNYLQTRGAFLDQFPQDKTYLYWLDALGVEYLPVIQYWTKKLDLNMVTHIARTDLPTITSVNKEFFDQWQEGMKNGKNGNKDLDTLKHNGIPGAKDAQYLERELWIVKSALEDIRRMLNAASTPIDKVVLTSDHGASRLAVLGGHENSWDMKEKGKHSGRCCPVSDLDVRPECATQENNFWVIANYQRFRGGRKADVEVHGGATLEEVVVPVIEFSLKTPKNVKVKEPGIAKVDKNQNADLALVCLKPLENAWVKWNDKSYPIQHCDGIDYKVTFTGVTAKQGEYSAEVFENDTALNTITFTIQKSVAKTSSISEMFD